MSLDLLLTLWMCWDASWCIPISWRTARWTHLFKFPCCILGVFALAALAWPLAALAWSLAAGACNSIWQWKKCQQMAMLAAWHTTSLKHWSNSSKASALSGKHLFSKKCFNHLDYKDLTPGATMGGAGGMALELLELMASTCVNMHCIW